MAPLDVAARADLISRISVFSGCTSVEIHDLASAARPIAFEPGEVLCVAGAPSPECYVVAEGQAEVSIGDHVINEVGPAQIVCEKGAIEGKPRMATVRARTGMVTYAISRDDLVSLMERSPQAAAAMHDELLRRYG